MKKEWIILSVVLALFLIGLILVFLINKPTDIVCAQEGELIALIETTGPTECCEGLSQGADYSIVNGECAPVMDVSICINCGDGVCESGETGCNCPEDCECAGSGEPANPENLQGKTDYADVCCQGLKAARGYGIIDGECEILSGNPYYWCIPCGNGVCDKLASIEENICNCPEDCEEPPLIGGCAGVSLENLQECWSLVKFPLKQK